MDIFLICMLNMGSGVMGAPWVCAATVRSVAHVSALTVMSRDHAPGDKPHIIEVKGVCPVVIFWNYFKLNFNFRAKIDCICCEFARWNLCGDGPTSQIGAHCRFVRSVPVHGNILDGRHSVL